MNEKKIKWMLQYKLEAPLTKKEMLSRIESEIAGYKGKGWISDVEKYFFLVGRIDGNGFKVYPNSLRISPRGPSNPLLPKIQGEVIAGTHSGSIVSFRLRRTPFTIFLFMLYLFGCFIGLAAGQVNLYMCLFIGCLIFYLMRQYWKFVGRRVVAWLSELLEAREVD